MRIALVHSYYTAAQSSGENLVVDAQAEALARAGHEVSIFSRSTDEEAAALSAYPLRAAYRTLTGRGPDPTRMLEAFRPDVVHIHNLVPNIGVGWVNRWPGPIVHTVHNYRALCSNANLFRDGKVCTECPDGKPWSGIVHGCYRDSRVKSIPITVRNARGVGRNTLLQRADALIVLSELQRGILARYGVPEDNMVVIPNGLPDEAGLAEPQLEPPEVERWVTVGRLSPEKGVRELLAIWPAGVPLDVFGDGPERAQLERTAPAGVVFRGQVSNMEVRAALPGYTGMVFPSRCFETQGMAIVEALAAGLPVVARAGSAGAEIACQGAVGWIYSEDATNSLRQAMQTVVKSGSGGRLSALQTFRNDFTQTVWSDTMERHFCTLTGS